LEIGDGMATGLFDAEERPGWFFASAPRRSAADSTRPSKPGCFGSSKSGNSGPMAGNSGNVDLGSRARRWRWWQRRRVTVAWLAIVALLFDALLPTALAAST
jgi:hypothetical protein